MILYPTGKCGCTINSNGGLFLHTTRASNLKLHKQIQYTVVDRSPTFDGCLFPLQRHKILRIFTQNLCTNKI